MDDRQLVQHLMKNKDIYESMHISKICTDLKKSEKEIMLQLERLLCKGRLGQNVKINTQHKTIDFLDLANLPVGPTLHTFINRIEAQNSDLISLLQKVQETSK